VSAAPIVERSEQEPAEAQRKTATRITAAQCAARVRAAPIVERSEQEPAEAQRKTATRNYGQVCEKQRASTLPRDQYRHHPPSEPAHRSVHAITRGSAVRLTTWRMPPSCAT
jgi:hypothetical protein